MLLTERYQEKIAGVLSCYDRIIIQGTIPGWSFDKGMTSFLSAQNIRIFDYPVEEGENLPMGLSGAEVPAVRLSVALLMGEQSTGESGHPCGAVASAGRPSFNGVLQGNVREWRLFSL
jgi:hypothetical protein